MSKAKGFLLAVAVATMVFTFSCSSDDGGGGDPQSYSYCIYIEAQVCFAGPYKDCPSGGIPSNSCPYDGVEPSSSSTDKSSSSAGGQSGSSQDGSPPELTNNRLGLVSPFDTLVAEFDSEIVGIDNLTILNMIETSQNMFITYPKGNKMYFTGTNATPGGSSYFNDGVVEDSIVFKNIKNAEGYIRKRTTLYFSTHRLLDNENNNIEADANDMDAFLNTTAKQITFAGVIDKKIGTDELTGYDIYDTRDYYKLSLKMGDIISITAKNNTAPFKIRFYGICIDETRGCNDKTIDITKNGALQDTIKVGHFKLDVPNDTAVPFYIVVSDGNTEVPSNPYQITIRKIN